MAGGDFLARIKLALEGKEQVVSGLQQTQQAAQQLAKTRVTTIFDKEGVTTGKQIEQTFTQISASAGKSFQQMGDFEKSLRRVILVAPVWMAFRTVLQGTFSLIRDGFTTWEAFDQALIKSKAVIHDYSGTTAEAMGELESTIRSFSKESGLALTDLASAFYRFGTVGIAFQDSLSGAIASAKLAKSTLGDVDTISRALAMTYRLLGDTIDSSLSPMEKQESLAGKILHLWKTNAFEANEFAASLNNFISTANIANFTADETVATLAALGTAGVQGSRGGALLKTSIFKLVENLDKLAGTLGLAVNPELEDTFSLFMRVLEAVNQLSKTEGIPVEAMKSIQEIFGGVRGAQAISALNALLPELKQNLIDLGKDPQKFIKDLNTRFKEVTDTVSGQLEIFRRLREQLGEAFVQGITGASDYKNALITINQLMEQIGVIAKEVGWTMFKFRFPLEAARIEAEQTNKEFEDFYNKIKKAQSGEMELLDIINLVTEVQERQKKFPETDYSKLIMQLKTEANLTAQNAVFKQQVEKEMAASIGITTQKRSEEIDKLKELSIVAQDKMDLAQNELQILELQKIGTESLVIEHTKLDTIVKTLVTRYNALKKVGGELVDPLQEQEVKVAVLAGDFNKVLNIFKSMKLSEKEINSLTDARNDINKAAYTDLDKFIKGELELAKLRGASNKQLFNLETSLNSQLFGENAITDTTSYRLELEKEITREKIEQLKTNGNAVTLLKIANDYGIKEAAQINEILAGRLRLKDVSQSTQYIFQKLFPTQFPELQAQEEFSEKLEKYLGVQKVRPGEVVPVPNLPTPPLQIIRPKEITPLPELKIPEIITNIGGISVNVSIDRLVNKEQIAKDIIENTKKALDDPNYLENLKKMVNRYIEEF